MAAEGIFKNSPKCFIGTNCSLGRLVIGAVQEYFSITKIEYLLLMLNLDDL